MVPEPDLSAQQPGPSPEAGRGAAGSPSGSYTSPGYQPGAPVPPVGYPPGGQYPPMPYPAAPLPPGPVPKPTALPVVPREYHEFLRTPRLRWWRPLAAIAMFVSVWFLISLVITTPAVLADLASGRLDPEAMARGEVKMTPWLFTMNNVSLALAVPLAGLTAWAVFGQRPRWLSSITGGFRWRLFWRFSAVAFVLLAISSAVEITLAGGLSGLAWNADSLFLIVVVLLTTPLQAAGEEYGLRGLLARSLGSWFGSRRVGLVVATVVTSVVFMALHMAADPWLNAFYLLFALLASVLVWRTGGLEAAVALHVWNNLIGEAALPFSPIDDIFNRQAGVAGPETLWQMGVMVVVTGAMLWWGRRMKLPRATAPGTRQPDRNDLPEVSWRSSRDH